MDTKIALVIQYEKSLFVYNDAGIQIGQVSDLENEHRLFFYDSTIIRDELFAFTVYRNYQCEEVSEGNLNKYGEIGTTYFADYFHDGYNEFPNFIASLLKEFDEKYFKAVCSVIKDELGYYILSVARQLEIPFSKFAGKGQQNRTGFNAIAEKIYVICSDAFNKNELVSMDEVNHIIFESL